MSDFWDYRGWERHQENNDWEDIQGENLEYRADALMNKAIRNGLDKDNIEKTIIYIAAANDLNREIDRLPELVRGLLMLGDCYLKQEKADEVEAVAIEAQRIALESFNDQARANAVHLQGYNYFVTKQYNKAAEFSLNAGEIYEEAGYYDEACDVYLAAGRLYRWRQERTRAIESFEKALAAARANNSLEYIVEAKLWIAFEQVRVSRLIDFETMSANLDHIESQMKLAKPRNSVTRRLELARAWNNIDYDPYFSQKYFEAWLEGARQNKNTNDAAEAMLGVAHAIRRQPSEQEFIDAMQSILAVLEEIESTVNPLEVAQPLGDFYLENGNAQLSELVWVRSKAIAEKNMASPEELRHYDQMIALCIAQYAEPERALLVLESSLPKIAEKPLPIKFEFALAKSYAANNRSTESLMVIERALENMGADSTREFEYAALHELRCELFDKQGNIEGARAEAKISFYAYVDLDQVDKAKRLKAKYLLPQPGDANPETGAITLGNWA